MSALEHHFSIPEIAQLWNLSPGAVRNIFRDRGDVIHLGNGETRKKRGYLTLRIPESVVVRVHDELKKRRVR
jgi:hypothetical protein